MPIAIQRTDDGYEAQASPPHCIGGPWRTAAPLPRDALVKELISRGCHQQDIGDAFHEADPQWLNR